MEFRTFDSDDEMLALFRTRALDVVALRTYQQYEDLVDRRHVHGGRENGASWTSIGMRVDRGPFSDDRVRRAVDLGIDRGALNEHVAQGQALLAGPVAPRLGGGDWALSQDELATLYQSSLTREERLQEARTLLDAAGATDMRFAMQVSDDAGLTDLASLVQAQLAEAGMQVSIDRLPLLRWYVNYRRGEFDATLISHPPFATPDGSLRLYHSSGGGGETNPFGFADSAIDALIERAWGEDDRDARRETVLEAQRLMIEARPMIHLIATNGYAAAHSYVGDSGLELPASLSRYHYRQWLGLPVDGRPA
jgi:peptide/nickel transport system substrate-binding protein